MRFEVAGANGVMVYFGEVISKEVSTLVISAYNHLRDKKIAGVISCVPSYTSMFVSYDVMRFNFKTITAKLSLELSSIDGTKQQNIAKLVEIPVYYDKEVGYDLESLAAQKNLSTEEIISLHSRQTYLVYAIGFAPGYAYMGLVDERIEAPRLTTPRKKVAKGSVGIADRQTAIYPSESPGGWNIIGRSPFLMFDPSLPSLCPLKVGDEVRFYPIDKEEFMRLGGRL
jgi:KipI family sensor histidine kinase inhibitor